MPLYNSSIAREVLTEAEKDRLLAVALSTTADNVSRRPPLTASSLSKLTDALASQSAINWEKATAEFGAASVDSMRVSVRNIHKKLDKAGAKTDGNDLTAGPSKAPKRKTAATEEDEVKTKKPRASKKKVTAAKSECHLSPILSTNTDVPSRDRGD